MKDLKREKGTNMTNIIFLDVDGVLNSYPYAKSLPEIDDIDNQEETEHDEIRDYHVQMLSKIYHSCNAKIVLSSTWRQLNNVKTPECRKMYKYLTDCLAKHGMEIIDQTPVIGLNRPQEIAAWLDERQDKDDINFVILDDDFPKERYDDYGIGDYLVHTDFFSRTIDEGGLQESHVQQAIAILQKK